MRKRGRKMNGRKNLKVSRGSEIFRLLDFDIRKGSREDDPERRGRYEAVLIDHEYRTARGGNGTYGRIASVAIFDEFPLTIIEEDFHDNAQLIEWSSVSPSQIYESKAIGLITYHGALTLLWKYREFPNKLRRLLSERVAIIDWFVFHLAQLTYLALLLVFLGAAICLFAYAWHLLYPSSPESGRLPTVEFRGRYESGMPGLREDSPAFSISDEHSRIEHGQNQPPFYCNRELSYVTPLNGVERGLYPVGGDGDRQLFYSNLRRLLMSCDTALFLFSSGFVRREITDRRDDLLSSRELIRKGRGINIESNPYNSSAYGGKWYLVGNFHYTTFAERNQSGLMV